MNRNPPIPIPAENCPREKLIKLGVKSLSDAELLALILRTGSKEKNVFLFSQDLLKQFKGLSGLLKSEFNDFRTVKGVGVAKFAQIAAIKEISQRSLLAEMRSQPVLDRSELAAEFLRSILRDYQKEVFVCLLLDTRNRLIGYEELFSGSISGASIYPREVVKLALLSNAAAVIFAHNHPSGCSQPSEADQQITQRLKKALKLIDVQVLDHIIVGDTAFSMAEQGLL